MATTQKDPKEIKEPKKNPNHVAVDIDDAMIEEPRDDAFRKSPQPRNLPNSNVKKADGK